MVLLSLPIHFCPHTPLHTVSKLYDVPIWFCIPPPLLRLCIAIFAVACSHKPLHCQVYCTSPLFQSSISRQIIQFIFIALWLSLFQMLIPDEEMGSVNIDVYNF